MKEEKKILRNYILYLLVGLLIIIYGMFHKIPITFALTNQNTIQFYDNNGNGANWVTTNYISQIQRSEATFTTQAGSYGGLVLAMLPTPVNTNHTYSIFLSVGAESNGGYTELSSKNCIGLGNTFAEAISSYVRCDYTPVYSRGSGQTGEYTRGLFWIFNSRQSASYIALPYTTQYTCTNCLQYSYGMEIQDNGDYTILDETELNTAITNQTNSIDTTIANMQSGITNSITQGNNTILQNSNANRQAIINNQNANNEALIEANKKNLNDCRDSYNLYNYQNTTSVTSGVTVDNEGWITVTYNNTNGTANKYFNYWTGNLTINVNTNYKIITEIKKVSGSGSLFTMSNSGNSGQFTGSIGYSFGSLSNNVIKTETKTTKTSFNNVADGLRTYIQFQAGQNGSITFRISVIKNTDSFTEYEEYGAEICTNKIDEVNKTSKSILGKLGDLLSYINPLSENFFVYKLIELLGDLLEDLFVPSQTYLNNWYTDFKNWIEQKLGFLSTPITLFLDFINLYINLEDGDLIINIPEIRVPNFEDHILIQARTFNWGELLNSKNEFKTLWTLYLDFIDVFLILNFIGLCEVTYNRIFGGDTTQYEYYTVEESYNINDDTGEATNHQLRERKTRRNKVV